MEYGAKDVDLTRRVANKKKGIENTFAMCAMSGISFQTCLDRGQGAKFEALMYQAMNMEHELW